MSKTGRRQLIEIALHTCIHVTGYFPPGSCFLFKQGYKSSHNKGGWWIHTAATFLELRMICFSFLFHSVYLWFFIMFRCYCAVFRFVDLWPFVLAVVGISHLFYSCLFLVLLSRHSDLCAVTLCSSFLGSSIIVFTLDFQLCPAIKCSQLFSTPLFAVS